MDDDLEPPGPPSSASNVQACDSLLVPDQHHAGQTAQATDAVPAAGFLSLLNASDDPTPTASADQGALMTQDLLPRNLAFGSRGNRP